MIQTRRIGILGGTFDPIHVGHLSIAQAAIEDMGLDGVVLIPAGEPSFKRGKVVASASARLEMCRIACAGKDSISVSDMEVARRGVTYSIDTVRQLLDESDDDVGFTFLLGADAARDLPSWHDASSLAKMVSFKVVPRAGAFEDMDGMLCRLRCAGFDIEAAPFCVEAVSSTDVRAGLACGGSAEALLPDGVARYIASCGLYSDLDCAMSSEFIAARREELSSRVNVRRLHHIEGVADTAMRLAGLYGVDEGKAFLAGLLHDWDKDYDDDGIRARVVELGIAAELDPFVIENMPQVLHGPTAACALSLEFPQIPSDVILAIRNHTTASVGASDLEKILYIADAIEPSRSFKEIEELRSMVGVAELDELFFSVYKFWTLLLLERGAVLHPDTMEIWNSLAAKRCSAGKASGGSGSRGKGKES